MGKKPRILLGFAAGVVGGLAGTAAKVIAEEIYPPREPGEPPPPHEVLADKMSEGVASRRLRTRERQVAGQAIHWTFGAVAGGVYGMLAEVWPQVTEGSGAAFGMALNLATHESTLPMVGLAPPPPEQSMQAHGSELSTHAVYGMTTEFVRRHVRSWLETREESPRSDRSLHSTSHVNLRRPA